MLEQDRRLSEVRDRFAIVFCFENEHREDKKFVECSHNYILETDITRCTDFVSYLSWSYLDMHDTSKIVHEDFCTPSTCSRAQVLANGVSKYPRIQTLDKATNPSSCIAAVAE